MSTSNLLQLPCQTLPGKTTTLEALQGKLYLIVNTASRCGLTPQYEGLEQLWQAYHEQGLVIAGFPCNQFGAQEPGSADDISSFCEINYGVSFPMFAKIAVNGPDTHPIYQALKAQAPGLLGSRGIKWNFTKFLVSAEGKVIRRYAPITRPEKLTTDIERYLKA